LFAFFAGKFLLSNHPIFSKETVTLVTKYVVEKYNQNVHLQNVHLSKKRTSLTYNNLHKAGYLKANEEEYSLSDGIPKGKIITCYILLIMILFDGFLYNNVKSQYILIHLGTRLYYDNDDGVPAGCDEIIIFKALLNMHFPRHSIQRFSHMFDCHNFTDINKSKLRSVQQSSHIDYFSLLGSIITGKRESIYDNLPLSFVIGIDDNYAIVINEQLNAALNSDHRDLKSVLLSNNAILHDKTYISVKPGHILLFSG
jgi:hypothetical protein